MRDTDSGVLYGDTARMEGRQSRTSDDGRSASDQLSEFESVLLAIAGTIFANRASGNPERPRSAGRGTNGIVASHIEL